MKACRQEQTEHTPVWLMRQAGRYMKEFREIRSKVGFLELCKNPALAAEVTVHAQETINADAAIIFADILLIADALDLGLEFVKGEGPIIRKPIRSQSDLVLIPRISVAEKLSYVFEAIKLTRQALRPGIPLLGFAAAPFTLASYMIEGSSSRNYELSKQMMYCRPDLWHELMLLLVEISQTYLNLQIAAGAQALQIFDSWAGALSPFDYETYVLPYSKQLISGINPGTPVIHFATGAAGILDLIVQAGSDVIGLDWRVDLASSWDKFSDKSVQGNLDPCLLLSDRKAIKSACQRLLDSVAGRKGHIFNLGHGVLPSTDPDNVKYLVELVKTHKYSGIEAKTG